MTKRLRVHLLNEHAIAPFYAHVDDSGMDIFSTEDVVIPSAIEGVVRAGYDANIEDEDAALDYITPGYAVVPTGISVEIPEGYEIQIRSKSGLAAKSGTMVLNSPGTIDEGYRGEIKVILANFGKTAYPVKRGQKIAQMVLCPVEKAIIIVMDDTQRKEGGIGSTGLQVVPEQQEVQAVTKTIPTHVQLEVPIKIDRGYGAAASELNVFTLESSHM